MFNSMKDAFKQATKERDNKGFVKLVNDISASQDKRAEERRAERKAKNESKKNGN